MLADPARQPGGAPAGEEHLATGFVELLGDLRARLAAPHHQHPALRQVAGRAVVGHVELDEPGRERGRFRGPVGTLVGTACDHHDAGGQLALTGRQHEAAAGRCLERGHIHALAHRRAGALGVVLQIGHDLVTRHEAVRIRPVVGMARQPAAPVGRDEAEALPAPAPGLAHTAALEHDMGHVPGRELEAHGEPGLAGADYDHVGAVAHLRMNATCAG